MNLSMIYITSYFGWNMFPEVYTSGNIFILLLVDAAVADLETTILK